VPAGFNKYNFTMKKIFLTFIIIILLGGGVKSAFGQVWPDKCGRTRPQVVSDLRSCLTLAIGFNHTGYEPGTTIFSNNSASVSPYRTDVFITARTRFNQGSAEMPNPGRLYPSPYDFRVSEAVDIIRDLATAARPEDLKVILIPLLHNPKIHEAVFIEAEEQLMSAAVKTGDQPLKTAMTSELIYLYNNIGDEAFKTKVGALLASAGSPQKDTPRQVVDKAARSRNIQNIESVINGIMILNAALGMADGAVKMPSFDPVPVPAGDFVVSGGPGSGARVIPMNTRPASEGTSALKIYPEINPNPSVNIRPVTNMAPAEMPGLRPVVKPLTALPVPAPNAAPAAKPQTNPALLPHDGEPVYFGEKVEKRVRQLTIEEARRRIASGQSISEEEAGFIMYTEEGREILRQAASRGLLKRTPKEPLKGVAGISASAGTPAANANAPSAKPKKSAKKQNAEKEKDAPADVDRQRLTREMEDARKGVIRQYLVDNKASLTEEEHKELFDIITNKIKEAADKQELPYDIFSGEKPIYNLNTFNLLLEVLAWMNDHAGAYMVYSSKNKQEVYLYMRVNAAISYALRKGIINNDPALLALRDIKEANRKITRIETSDELLQVINKWRAAANRFMDWDSADPYEASLFNRLHHRVDRAPKELREFVKKDPSEKKELLAKDPAIKELVEKDPALTELVEMYEANTRNSPLTVKELVQKLEEWKAKPDNKNKTMSEESADPEEARLCRIAYRRVVNVTEEDINKNPDLKKLKEIVDANRTALNSAKFLQTVKDFMTENGLKTILSSSKNTKEVNLYNSAIDRLSRAGEEGIKKDPALKELKEILDANPRRRPAKPASDLKNN